MARLIVHLVHGTQFYLWRKPQIPWVEQEPPFSQENEHFFRTGLRSLLEEKGHVVEFRVVEWSGRNRHGARQAAADQIRQSIGSPEEGTFQFLVAHSHGGNACMLALKEDAQGEESSLSGIVCLATPFLIVSKAPWALAATVAWFLLMLFLSIGLLDYLFDGWLAVALGMVSCFFWMVPIALLGRRYRDPEKWNQSPPESRVPLLIARCPGDEASSGLGFVAILARLVYLLEHLAAWPIRMLQRRPVTLWLGGTALLLGSVIAGALYPPLAKWWDRSWKWVLLILLGPLMVGLPVRLVVYGLAYGLDLFGLPLALSVSAETSPLGRWHSWLVEPQAAEELRSAHSEIYELRSVQRIIAAWFDELVADAATRATAGYHPRPGARPVVR